MRSTLPVVLLVVLLAPGGLGAQSMKSAEPFKVGTFQIEGKAVVGLVLRDSLIVEIWAANNELEVFTPRSLLKGAAVSKGNLD